MREEVKQMVDRYELLAHKLNHMTLKAQLRFKVAITDEMNVISKGLKLAGLWQDGFGKWH